MANTQIAGPNERQSIEAGTIYIPKFMSGLFTQRNPLAPVLSQMGIQVIQKLDALYGGLNMEMSLDNTLVRRPGFPAISTATFGASEWPLTYYGFKNLAGTIFPMVDTQLAVYTFTPTSKTVVFSKSPGSVQTSFQKIGNTLYMADGIELLQWTGSGTPPPVGIAVPTQAPNSGNAPTTISGIMSPPTSGISYGYSYANSTTGHVSTMSPAGGTTGDLNITKITEAKVQLTITSMTTLGDGVTVGGSASGYHVVFGCVNNLAIGQTVVVSGISNPPYANATYVVTARTLSSFTALTDPWGDNVGSGHGPGYANAHFALSNLSGLGVMNPITVPGNTTGDPAGQAYTYTVTFSASNNPANTSGSPVAGTSGSASTAVVTVNGAALTPSATSSPASGSFYDDGSGNYQFNSNASGKKLVITYGITPTYGTSAPVSFVVTGPSSASLTQPDETGFADVDSIDVFRTLDGDAAAGPWYLLATIPNNISITAVTIVGGQAVYTFANTVPAGANNGFAGAAGTQGATIVWSGTAGNQGTFDIVASTANSITTSNTGGTAESGTGTINGVTWEYVDTGSVYGYAYNSTTPDGEVNELVEAPIDYENNPPPANVFTLLCYSAGRLWGATGNYVYFSGGPDTTFGNGNEAWPPANVFEYPGTVTALAAVSSGLLVWTDVDMYIIYGTTADSFYNSLYQKNFGVRSQNAIAQDGDNLFLYTSRSQLYCFGDQLAESGFSIGDQLKRLFAPATTYLALHRDGNDSGLFVSDGSTNMYRYRLDAQSWSTVAQVAGGAGCIASIDLPATFDVSEHYWLLTGRVTGSGQMLGRTMGVFEDQGVAYPASGIVGSIVVAAPGKTALIKSVLIDYMPVGSKPTLSILPNEISGAFITLPNPVPDPPLLPPSKSVSAERHYLRAANQPIPEQMRHLQVQIVFAAENYQSELLSLGLG